MIEANRIAYQLDNLKCPSLTRGSALVTRAIWTCSNLPEGLMLSEDGELSGRPTTTGIYVCTVTVTTNWGSAEKTIRIRITK